MSDAKAARGWDRRHGGRPLVLGHRGASALAPENSVDAFRRAMADGADGVELDVLVCATGEIVVFHDDDLARLAGRPERVSDVPFAALRTMRLRSGAQVPTLDEAFEAVGRDALVNVELKTDGVLDPLIPELVEGTARIIERLGVADRVLISSFSPVAVARAARRLPGVRRGALFERSAPWPLRRGWAAPFVRAAAVHPEHVLCTPERVASWHERGYAVNVWTVDGEPLVRSLCDMGVDALITNDPGATRAFVERWASAR